MTFIVDLEKKFKYNTVEVLLMKKFKKIISLLLIGTTLFNNFIPFVQAKERVSETY